MKRPAFILTIFLITGLLLGTFINIPFHIGVAAVAIVIVHNLYCWRVSKINKAIPPSGISLFICILILGILIQNKVNLEDTAANIDAVRLANKDKPEIFAKVHSVETFELQKIIIIIKDISANDFTAIDESGFNSKKIHGKGRVLVLSNAANAIFAQRVVAGDIVRICGKIKIPSEERNPDSFNYRKYLNNKGVYFVSTVYEKEQLTLLKREPKSLAYMWGRILVESKIYSNRILEGGLSGSASKTALAILTGNTSGFSMLQYENFKRVGLLHIFAVSGLHSTMIAFMLYFLFRIINIGRIARSILTFLALLFFIAFSGFAISAVRSLIMVSALLINDLYKREKGHLDALSFACFATLLINPRALSSPSFQLSYTAVFFILLNSPFLMLFLPKFDISKYHLSRFRHNFAKYITMVILSSLLINISMLPIVANYYHQFSIISPIANLFAIPLSFIILSLSLLSVTLGALVGALQPLLLVPVEIACRFFNALAHIAGSLPFASVRCLDFPFWAVLIYYLILFLGKNFLAYRNIESVYIRKWHTIIHYLAAFAFFLILKTFSGSHGNMNVTFLDVGQGDAAFVSLPSGTNILIDAGRGAPVNAGYRIVAPFLFTQGVYSIDAMILTHPDSDHIGGAYAIMENFPIALLMKSHHFEKTSEGAALISFAKEKNIVVRDVSRGTLIYADGARIDILNPDSMYEFKSDNDNSIVVRISYGEIDMLFTGDAEKKAVEKILAGGENIESEIIKIGHHGSASSTGDEFLTNVNPKAAVISVGEKNIYGHPSVKTLDMLKSKNIRCFRTDRNGAVNIETDGLHFYLWTEIN